jgi:exopolysaccharide biosynthesis polyprenyl glycosylphosphotransferase
MTVRAQSEAAALAVLVAGVIVVQTPGTMALWREAAAVAARAVVLAGATMLVCYYANLYEPPPVDGRGTHFRLPVAVAAAALVAYALGLTMPALRVTPEPVLSAALIVTMLLAVRAAGSRLLDSPALTQRVLLLGNGPLARALVEEIEARTDLPWVLFVPGDAMVVEGGIRRRRSASPAGLRRIVDDVQPDRIVVALDQRHGIAARQLLESRARGVPVEDGFDLYERLTGKIAIEAVTPTGLLFGRGFRRARLHRGLARLLSVVVAGVALIASLPLIALVALAVKVESRGPVFFVHDRIGLGGRPFRLVKFRTMRPAPGPTSEWARDNDDRITRLGRCLRTFRLDELPQLVNVLRGDMNIVGPRPHPVTNATLFAARIPYYSLRSVVRPGITGWAQVRYGYANGLEEETEKMRYDLYYVKRQSIWLDLRILLDTIKVVAGGLETHAPRTSEDARPMTASPVAQWRDAA